MNNSFGKIQYKGEVVKESDGELKNGNNNNSNQSNIIATAIPLQCSIPAGVVVPFAGNNVPYGWLLCDGSAVSRSDYVTLFNAIGIIWGSGDGINTFNLPDLRENVPVGINCNSTHSISSHDVYTLGEFKDDQMESHSHST